MKRKSNKKVWDALTEKHSDYLIQAGWFENSKYSNGAPIGGIAAVQNYGAVINQSRGESSWTIVIPPTHFWEAAQEENKVKWKQKFQEAWQSVFLGNINPDTAMERIALMIEGDIAKAIAAVDNPPLKESTIKKRQSRMADKKTKGSLTKRLIDTGEMFDSVSHKVTKL